MSDIKKCSKCTDKDLCEECWQQKYVKECEDCSDIGENCECLKKTMCYSCNDVCPRIRTCYYPNGETLVYCSECFVSCAKYKQFEEEFVVNHCRK
jgi:hypothetical protein